MSNTYAVDLIAGALKCSRAYAYEVMRAALASNAPVNPPSARIAELEALLVESQAALAKASRDLMEVSLEARGLGNPSAPLREEACGHSPEPSTLWIDEKFGYVTTLRTGQQFFYKNSPYVDNAIECEIVYTRKRGQLNTSGQQGRAPTAEVERSDEQGLSACVTCGQPVLGIGE